VSIARAAEAAFADPPEATPTWCTIDLDEPSTTRHSVLEAIDAAALGARLDADLGVEREPRRLNRLIADVSAPDDASTASTDLLIASLAARAALLRRESRGAWSGPG
jgi:aspartate oxidase